MPDDAVRHRRRALPRRPGQKPRLGLSEAPRSPVDGRGMAGDHVRTAPRVPAAPAPGRRRHGRPAARAAADDARGPHSSDAAGRAARAQGPTWRSCRSAVRRRPPSGASRARSARTRTARAASRTAGPTRTTGLCAGHVRLRRARLGERRDPGHRHRSRPGSLGDEACTAERFVHDPVRGERLYRTGALGPCPSDGEIDILAGAPGGRPVGHGATDRGDGPRRHAHGRRAGGGAGAPPVVHTPEGATSLKLTSGSTGEPKTMTASVDSIESDLLAVQARKAGHASHGYHGTGETNSGRAEDTACWAYNGRRSATTHQRSAADGGGSGGYIAVSAAEEPNPRAGPSRPG